MRPEDVYTVARLVPPGRVVSYGDIAALFDANPRQVGSHLGRCNAPGVPWWRVTNASGRLPALADAAELALGPLPGLRGPRVEPAERPVGD